MNIKKIIATFMVSILSFGALNVYADDEDGKRHLTFTNESKDIITLDISKEVENADPMYPAPVDDEFEFAVYVNDALYADKVYRVYDSKGAEIYKYVNVDGGDYDLDDVKYTTDLETLEKKISNKSALRLDYVSSSAGTITLKDGQRASFEKVRLNASYKVEEMSKAQYVIVDSKGSVGTISENDNSVYYKNMYLPPETGSKKTKLQIRKDISSPAGFEIPETKKFSFKVEISNNGELKPLANEIFEIMDNQTGLLTGTTGMTNDDGIFKLSAGKTAVFNEVTVDKEYKVSEVDTDGWWSIGEDVIDPMNDYREGITSAPLTMVNFRNTDCSFVVSKTLSSDSSEDDNNVFTFVLKDKLGAPMTGAKYYLYTISGDKKTQIVTDINGDNYSEHISGIVDGNGEFVLHADEAALFVNIPVGTSYSVSEKPSIDYTQITPNSPSGYQNKTVVDSIETLEFINKINEPMTGLYVSKVVTDNYGRLEEEQSYTFILKKWDEATSKYVPVSSKKEDGTDNSEGNFIYVQSGLSRTVGSGEHAGEFTMQSGDNVFFNRLKVNTKYIVEEINPNPIDEHIYFTDVMTEIIENEDRGSVESTTTSYNTGDTFDVNPKSEEIVLTKTTTGNVSFNNITLEPKYFFNIEKSIYVDTFANKDSDSDKSQRFVFRIEHYASESDMLQGKNIMATYYTDFSCTDKITGGSGDKIITESGYEYPYIEYRGIKTLMVNKRGWYKITEVTEWSSTDYDYRGGSNKYLGGTGSKFTDNTKNSENRSYVAFCIEDEYKVTQTLDKFPTAKFENLESEYAYRSGQAYSENHLN